MKQGGTADKVLFVLDRSFLSRTFLLPKGENEHEDYSQPG